MSDDTREHSFVPELKRLFAEGLIDRREFLRTATLLGVSAGVAYAFAGKLTGERAMRTARAAMPKGGRLNIGMRVQEIKHPPTYAWITDSNVTRQVCEYLTKTGHDNVTRPYLAESWEASDDLRTWTFRLRKVNWHNGRPFTADDVVWNLKNVLDPQTGSSVLGLMKGYMLEEVEDADGNTTTKLWDADAIEKLDDHTVRLNLKEPQLAVPEHLFHYPLLITDPEEGGEFGVGSNGTGAFELVEHRIGERSLLKARADYWGEGPHVDELFYIDLGDDPSTAVAALASKQVHGLYEADATQLGIIGKLGHVQPYQAETAWTAVARTKVTQKPFDDPRVRTALRKCIDQKKVLESAYFGVGVPAEHHHVHPIHPEYADLPFFQQDIEGAKRLLAEAGHPDGLDLELTCKNDPPWELAAVQTMKEMWAKAGIRVKINNMPSASYWDVWDKAPFGFTQWAHRPLGVMVLGLAYRSGVPWNESEFSNPEFDRLLAKAEGTLDVDARRKIMDELERIMQEEGPITQPLWRNVLTGYDKRVKGFQMHPTNYIFANELAIES